MSIVNVYEPTTQNPYIINEKIPLILRTACTAGVNRSATVREYITPHIPIDSSICAQYGAEYGDYENKVIQYHTSHNDGFNELFGKEKATNVQALIFINALGYPKLKDDSVQILDEHHRYIYTDIIRNTFWTVKDEITPQNKNVFILINENEDVIKLVLKRLTEVGEPVDYVVLRVPDVIHTPSNKKIKSQSIEAYKEFIEIIKKLIVFV